MRDFIFVNFHETWYLDSLSIHHRDFLLCEAVELVGDLVDCGFFVGDLLVESCDFLL
jgi:hypothetical protein